MDVSEPCAHEGLRASLLIEGRAGHRPSRCVERSAAAMLIRLDDPSLCEDLCAHFERSGFVAEIAGKTTVHVSRFGALDPDREREEIELHLRVWRAADPERGAEVV